MSRLFKRNASLVVGDLDITGKTSEVTEKVAARSGTHLRFSFTVEKHLKKEPNTGHISVWNLSEDHRRNLEDRKDGIPVILSAGLGEDSSLLFKGLLDVALSERDGADWITNIYTDDGKDAVHARGAVSYRAGANWQKVLKDLADKMNVGVGNLFQVIDSASSVKEIGSALPHGLVSKGGAADALFQIVDDLGYSVSIQDGELEASKKNQPVDPTATVLKPTTGLLGSPAVDRKGRIEGSCLIIPGVAPGKLIQVDASTAKGNWLVTSATYIGDTAGSDWVINFEGRPLS